jgi:DNA adenine methylase
VKSPIRWQGGKRKLADFIISRMPPHAAYVEGCCGGASVFWGKPAGLSSAEILNDADGELINFYCVLHKRGRRLAAELDAMPYSRAFFSRMLASRPRSAFSRAARFWYINRVNFGGRRRGATFGPNATRRAWVLPPSLLASLEETIERLRGVLFESVDVVRLLELYDRPDTLFYLDPPFYATSQEYACRFGEQDHRRLAEALRRCRGAWLLSYDDCPSVRALYAGCTLAELSTRYTAGCNSRTGGRSTAAELLISNRPLKEWRLDSPAWGRLGPARNGPCTGRGALPLTRCTLRGLPITGRPLVRDKARAVDGRAEQKT